MSETTLILLWMVFILGTLNSILYFTKYRQTKNTIYLVSIISRIYVALASGTVLIFGFNTLDRFYLNIGLSFVLLTDFISNTVYFAGKKYRETIESKRLLNTLNNLEAKYTTIVENALVGFYVIDESSKFEYVNPKFCEVTGYSKSELLSMKFIDLVTPEFVSVVLDDIHNKFCDKVSSTKFRIDLVRKDGKVISVEKLGTVTTNGHRTITGNILPI